MSKQNDKVLKRIQAANEAAVMSAPNFGSLGITISKYATDTDGTIIDKNLLPDAMKIKYPVFLFSAFDFAGAYNGGNQIIPLLSGGVDYVFSGIFSAFFDLLSFTGVNNVKEKLAIGDFIQLYTDDINAPNFFVWIVISCKPRAYGSVLQNPLSKGMEIFAAKMFVDIFDQYNEVIYTPAFDEVGNYSHDQFGPLQFLTPDYQELNFIRIPLNYILTNWVGLYFYMVFESEKISFEFRYNKPLIK